MILQYLHSISKIDHQIIMISWVEIAPKRKHVGRVYLDVAYPVRECSKEKHLN